LIDKPLIPTKTGYSFVGWYTFEGLPVTFPYNLTSNVTLYAHWSPNEYSVTYNANGGTWASAKDRAIYNTTYKIPATTPKKAGYTFTGWNASGSVTGAYSAGSGFTMGAGKVTLTAGWKINSYTVIFNANGKAFASKTAVYNTIIIASSNPSKPKYSFKGWYTSASGGTKITFPYKVTNNINLYAQWTLFTSTVVNNPKVQIGSKNSAVVKWNSIAGATGYQIYRATFSSGAYSLIATVSNVNFTNYSLIKNKTYYYRVRAYQTNGTSKVYSGYSKVVSIKL